MVNLFDIMGQAQSGAALGRISEQFGLTSEQTTRAMEALLPAFTLGFQKSLQDPMILGQLLQLMSSGLYGTFYDGGRGATAGQGQQALKALFGSPEVSRQIAAQASTMTGIGAQVLQQMLPVIAATLVGGLFKFMSVEGFSDFLRRWADWLQHLKPSEPARASDGSDPYLAWSDAMAGWLGAPRRPAPPSRTEPWTSFTNAMLGKATSPPPPPSADHNPFEVLSRMVETGREVQAQHLAGLQAILNGMFGGKATT